MSVVSNKKINANSSWAGNPAKKVKEGIFRNRPCVHTWTEDKTKESMFYDKDNFIFTYRGDEYISFDEREEKLDAKASVDSKIEYLGKISADKHKNRFCSQKVKQKRWFKRTVRKIKRKAACLKTAVFHRS